MILWRLARDLFTRFVYYGELINFLSGRVRINDFACRIHDEILAVCWDFKKSAIAASVAFSIILS